jgi:hypothetical protein
MAWNPPHPVPLLHKCAEEREKTQAVPLLEPAGEWRADLDITPVDGTNPSP